MKDFSFKDFEEEVSFQEFVEKSLGLLADFTSIQSEFNELVATMLEMLAKRYEDK